MKRIAGITSLVFAGLFAGFLTAVLVLELSLRRFDGTVYTQVRLVELDSLDKLAVATLLPALISTAVLAYRSFRTKARWPSVAAFVRQRTVILSGAAFCRYGPRVTLISSPTSSRLKLRSELFAAPWCTSTASRFTPGTREEGGRWATWNVSSAGSSSWLEARVR